MKKLFGKRGIALLTTLALVISMVAMLGGLTASAAEYTPKRAISMKVSNNDVNAKYVITGSGTKVGEGKTVTVKGYYKLENYVAQDDSGSVTIASGVAKLTADTDGWVSFEKADYVTGDANWLLFEYWHATGTLSLADVVFEDAEGNIIYDLATDEDLVEGTHKSHTAGMWYMHAYNNPDNAEITIDPIYVSPVYTPERTMSVSATVDSLDAGAFQAAFMLARVGEFFGYSTEYTVKGYYKVADFVSVDASSKATLGAAGVEQVAEWTAFETTYTSKDSGEAWSDYGFWNAGGTLYLADIVLEKDGVVVYDMATDVNLVAGEYTTAQTMGVWYLGKWGAGTGSYKFVIDEAVEAEDPCANGHKYVGGVCERCGDEKEYPVIEGDPNYVPDRVMSIETFGGSKGAAGTAIEGKFLLTRGYFPGHSVVYIKGYYKIENYREAVTGSDNNVQIGAGGGCNPSDSYAAKGNTNGWVAFSIGFIPKSEDNTDWEGCGKFGHWFTHGKLSLADVTIESRDGEVLYDMRYDESLPTGTTAGGTGFLNGEDKGIQTDRWYIGAYGYDDFEDIEVVVTEALDKPAQTGDADIFFVVALGTMAAITLAVVTLNKKKFSV